MKQKTTGDELLERVREAAEVPAYDSCARDNSGEYYTGWEVLASRFNEMDAWMCSHDGEPPQEWKRFTNGSRE